MTAVPATDGVVAGYLPGVDILTRRLDRGERGRARDGDRPERCRQVHADQDRLRPALPAGGPDRAARRGRRGLAPHEITRKGLSYVPQVDNVFPSLTVHENLEVCSLERERTDERIERAYAIFPRLAERAGQRVGTMSGGERQMVAMARAMMSDPQILLLDEPSAGLAPAVVAATFEKIAEINRGGITVVMVEQNARRALRMSHRGYVLDGGKDRFTGPGRELLDNPDIVEMYLGGAPAPTT